MGQSWWRQVPVADESHLDGLVRANQIGVCNGYPGKDPTEIG